MPHAPLPQIDAVERLMVTVGLKSIISREVERFTKAKLATMNNIPKEVSSLARKLVHGELTPSFYSDFNWKAAVKELARGWDVDQVVEMTKNFPAGLQVTGSALVVKSKETIQLLLEGYPLQQYQTLTGSINILPPDTKLFRFVSVLEVVADPLMVFSLMCSGALLRSQAHAVRTVFPTLSAAIDAAILQSTISAKAEKKSFELPPKAEVGVKAWYGKGPVDASMMQSAQATHARAQARLQAHRDARAADKAKQSLLTSTQKDDSIAA